MIKLKVNFKILLYALVFVLAQCLNLSIASAEWKVDLTRRSGQLSKHVLLEKEPPKKSRGVFDAVFSSSEPIQEIVILNTEKGFVPSKIKVREGHQYKVHVVNVAEKNKNVSFVMESFSEFHSTYFGKINTFKMKPKATGVFNFQCPETSAQGKLVVLPNSYQGPSIRQPASEQ